MSKAKKRIDLKGDSFIGTVIYNNDPTFSGRCKVRVLGVMNGIEDGAIPWATPSDSPIFSSAKGYGSLSVPKVGSLVRVRFQGGEYTSPEYTAVQNMDPNLVSEIKDDYLGTQVLLYDSDNELALIFQPKLGFKIYYKESFIQITPDNMITIEHANTDSIIQLKGKEITIASGQKIDITSASEVNISSGSVNINGNNVKFGAKGSSVQSAVLGDNLVKVLTQMMHQIDMKYPISPGYSNPLTLNSILSKTVTLSK